MNQITIPAKLDPNARLKELIAQKREMAARIANVPASAPAKKVPEESPTPAKVSSAELSKSIVSAAVSAIPASSSPAIQYNEKQILAIESILNDSIHEICFIGAAGTGKTTCVKEAARRIIEEKKPEKLSDPHKHIPTGTPGVVFTSFTNRAVRNLRKVLPEELRGNAVTVHALLEYYFTVEESFDEDGNVKRTRKSVPRRCGTFPLRGIRYLFIDESSMLGLDLFSQLEEALPRDCKIIYMGDLNQLPPVYSSAILGYKLCDPQVPTVELTEVYRQALDNPILAFAHNILKAKKEKYAPVCIVDGKADIPPALTIKAFKRKNTEPEITCIQMGKFFQNMIDMGGYIPEEDCILIPYNKSFGTLELNRWIAQKLQEKRKSQVYEIFAGFFKTYLSVGDRILWGKNEGVITSITDNAKYSGPIPRLPSILLDRWGHYRKPTAEDIELDNTLKNLAIEELEKEISTGGGLSALSMKDIDAILNAQSSRNEEGKREASHIISVEIAETGETVELSEAGEINAILFAYAITVHKSQGAEWRRVFFILHGSHAQMFSRELIYTGVTRAREELILLCEQDAIYKCIERQRIKGNTLAEKAEFFKGKKEELQGKQKDAFNYGREEG